MPTLAGHTHPLLLCPLKRFELDDCFWEVERSRRMTGNGRKRTGSSAATQTHLQTFMSGLPLPDIFHPFR